MIDLYLKAPTKEAFESACPEWMWYVDDYQGRIISAFTPKYSLIHVVQIVDSYCVNLRIVDDSIFNELQTVFGAFIIPEPNHPKMEWA